MGGIEACSYLYLIKPPYPEGESNANFPKNGLPLFKFDQLIDYLRVLNASSCLTACHWSPVCFGQSSRQKSWMSGTWHKEWRIHVRVTVWSSFSGSMSDSIWQGSVMGMVGWALNQRKGDPSHHLWTSWASFLALPAFSAKWASCPQPGGAPAGWQPHRLASYLM